MPHRGGGTEQVDMTRENPTRDPLEWQVSRHARDRYEFDFCDFTAHGEYLAPAILPYISLPVSPGHRGIVLSGKGPQWLYAYLTYLSQVPDSLVGFSWVGVFDPAQGGAVVVRTEENGPALGDIIACAPQTDREAALPAHESSPLGHKPPTLQVAPRPIQVGSKRSVGLELAPPAL